MGRSRLPLIALLGAVGCTKQDTAAPHDAAPADDSPLRAKGARQGDESGKGASIRALSPEERANLVSPPLPEPEAARMAPEAPAAPASEPSDAGTAPDYAERRRQQLNQRHHGKGSGIQRTNIRFTRGGDSSAPAPAKKN